MPFSQIIPNCSIFEHVLHSLRKSRSKEVDNTFQQQFCCCSIAKSCPALCDPLTTACQASLSCTYLSEFAQTQVHSVGDAIKLSYPLSPLLLLPSIFPRTRVFPSGSDSKESVCNVEDLGSIPGSGRSLEKEVSTYSSILVWRIPWTEKLGGLQSMVAKSQT